MKMVTNSEISVESKEKSVEKQLETETVPESSKVYTLESEF